jgi:hypothetical protein
MISFAFSTVSGSPFLIAWFLCRTNAVALLSSTVTMLHKALSVLDGMRLSAKRRKAGEPIREARGTMGRKTASLWIEGLESKAHVRSHSSERRRQNEREVLERFGVLVSWILAGDHGVKGVADSGAADEFQGGAA